MMQIGSSTHSVLRTRSYQKFPSVRPPRRTKPRMTAIAIAKPAAAETKLWKASPAI